MLFFVLFCIFLYVLNAFINPFPAKSVPEGFRPKYGTSFNFEESKWFGQDPREQYIKMLDTYKLDWVRLPFFWDKALKADGSLDLEDIKFAITEAEKRNVKRIVAVGVKTPYHPEFHIPEKYQSKVKFGDTITTSHPIADEVLKTTQKVVAELSVYDNIGWWQVENEPFLANINNVEIDRDFLAKEVILVRETDPLHRPIILTNHGPSSFDSEWKKYFEILEPGDIFGVNAFFKIQGPHLFSFSFGGKNFQVPWPSYVSWPAQSWPYLSADYAGVKKYSQNKKVQMWVMEMQAEPYIRTISDSQKRHFEFSSEDIKKADRFLKALRIDSVGLWGVNFWLYRDSLGDKSWSNSVLDMLAVSK